MWLAGEAVLSDLMPSAVAETLKRKALHGDGGAGPGPGPFGAAPPDALSDSPLATVVYKQWHPAVTVLFAGRFIVL